MWSPVELTDKGEEFIEYTPGGTWTENFEDDDSTSSYSDIYLRVASRKRFYGLEPYKILDLLGDMGGLLDIVFAIGTLMTIASVKNAFDRSLLSDAYQVQGKAEDKTELYKSHKARQWFKENEGKSSFHSDHDDHRRSETNNKSSV